MRLKSKFNKGFRFLLGVIDIYSQYSWVFPLKDKKGITITNAFHKIWMNQITNQKEYRYNFQGTLNPICSCGNEIETTIYYQLHCQNYLNYLDTLGQSSKYCRKHSQ